jgi:carbonic anhydrase
MTSSAGFSDVLQANETYADNFEFVDLRPLAAKGLAVLTCMDSRIEPLGMLGLQRGDAKILRNAGARVTDDVLHTLVVARYLLAVDRVMVVAHTRCRMANASEADIHEAIDAAGGPDSRSIAFLTAEDQTSALISDVQRIRSWPYLTDTEVGGFIYDLGTGRLRHIC